MVKKASARGRPPVPERRQRRLWEAKEAAFTLFLELGLEGVTIDQIAQRAGWSKGNFYRYFENKEALLEWVYAPLEAQIREAFARLAKALSARGGERDARGAYELFGAQLSLALLQDRQAAMLYLQERRGPSVGARRPICRIARLIEEEAIRGAALARSRGALREVDPSLVGLSVVGAIEQVLHGFLTKRLSEDVLEVTAELSQLLLGGILREGA